MFFLILLLGSVSSSWHPVKTSPPPSLHGLLRRKSYSSPSFWKITTCSLGPIRPTVSEYNMVTQHLWQSYTCEQSDTLKVPLHSDLFVPSDSVKHTSLLKLTHFLLSTAWGILFTLKLLLFMIVTYVCIALVGVIKFIHRHWFKWRNRLKKNWDIFSMSLT